MADSDSIKPQGYYFDPKKQAFRVDISMRHNGTRLRRTKLLPKTASESDAKAVADDMRIEALRENIGIDPSAFWIAEVERVAANKGSWFGELFSRAKKRAAIKRRAMTLTKDDLKDLLLRSRGRCEVSGLAFSNRVIGKAKMRPLSPSIDRINALEGYHKDNCRIVCSAVNIAMFNWGESIFKGIALGYVINQILAKDVQALRVDVASIFLTPTTQQDV